MSRMCYIDGMNAEHIGNDWTCEKCGRQMNPHGDCVRCDKIERARAEAAGERKRAKNIVAGDVIRPNTFKIESIEVRTVEHTSKGKVIINKGRGHCFEDTFQSEQWVDICIVPKQDVTPEAYEAANLPAMGGFH